MTFLTTKMVRTRVRNLSGDNGGLLFSDDTLIDWINDAIQEIVVDNSLKQATASSNTVVGQNEYSPNNDPDTMIKLHSIIVDGEKLTTMSMAEFEQQFANKEAAAATGKPTAAYIWAGKLVLWPKPDAVYTLKINYIARPALVTTAAIDTPEVLPLPSPYHLRVITYCLAQIAFQDDDMSKYEQLMADFKSGVLSARTKDLEGEEEDYYPSISGSDRDLGYDY